MNGHGEDMTGYDPEAEQAMAALWAEWEFYSTHRADAKADKAERTKRWLLVAAASVAVVAAWFAFAEILHEVLT